MHSQENSDRRRQKAEECLAKANLATTEKERLQWLDLADLWLAKPDQGQSEH